MIPRELFPRLTDTNYRITSPESTDYNCVAWAAGDTSHWWQRGVYWPKTADDEPDDWSVQALFRAFQSLGFGSCDTGELEPGLEKIALYANGAYYTHVSLQLPNGKWTSKLGKAEDIEHATPDDLAQGAYGLVVMFMKRPKPKPTAEPSATPRAPA